MIIFLVVMILGGVAIGIVLAVVIAAKVTIKDRRLLKEIESEVADGMRGNPGQQGAAILRQALITKAGGITYAPKREQAYKLIDELR